MRQPAGLRPPDRAVATTFPAILPLIEAFRLPDIGLGTGGLEFLDGLDQQA